jgi:hypothetical protein
VVARPQGSASHATRRIQTPPPCSQSSCSRQTDRSFSNRWAGAGEHKIKSEFNKFPFVVIDPVTVLDEAAKWDKQWNELFVRR